MQCAACRTVYSDTLAACPRCQKPVSPPSPESAKAITVAASRRETKARAPAKTDSTTRMPKAAAQAAKQPPRPPSTLIEFPKTGRAARPPWRNELSERVREIQQRRAREAAFEAEETARQQAEQADAEAAHPQLGLVPPLADTPELNPLVIAALRRIERARQGPPMASRSRASSSGAAAAVARVAEENYQTAVDPDAAIAPTRTAPTARDSQTQPRPAEKPKREAEAARSSGLVVVPAHQPEAKSPPRRVTAEIVDDTLLASRERAGIAAAVAPVQETYIDRASLSARFVGGILDLLVIAFASSPFAAIIELTHSNWADLRVAASMSGIVLLVMFLYLTASIALAGRSWGMSLVSLYTLDADTGQAPTTGQCVRRTLVYMLSLATFGLGIVYALFDEEGRTAHDHFSATIVVRE